MTVLTIKESIKFINDIHDCVKTPVYLIGREDVGICEMMLLYNKYKEIEGMIWVCFSKEKRIKKSYNKILKKGLGIGYHQDNRLEKFEVRDLGASLLRDQRFLIIFENAVIKENKENPLRGYTSFWWDKAAYMYYAYARKYATLNLMGKPGYWSFGFNIRNYQQGSGLMLAKLYVLFFTVFLYGCTCNNNNRSGNKTKVSINISNWSVYLSPYLQ